MNKAPSLLNYLFMLTVIGLLTACDNGVGTTSNADLNTGDRSYTGPAAKTADIRSFQLNFWQFLKEENRCGQCHGKGQTPTFVNLDDVNKAYSEAVKYTDLENPSDSEFVSKVGGGHQCWLDSLNACATIVEQMISNWATDSNITSARLIQLQAPTHHVLGEFKSFPPDADSPGSNGGPSFEDTVYPLLVGTTPVIANNNCQRCHEEVGPQLPQAPFFASPDVDSAYAAARSKMNLASPAKSRFVERLQQSHNCWTNCPADATTMEDAIDLFAAGITATEVDDTLLTSMAMTLADGVIAAGGNRHESNLFALWEFKTRSGITAYDTSGIEPAIDLTLVKKTPSDDTISWLGSYGLKFNGGRAQALTFDSEKMHTFIQSTGEYAIEAWVVPANVTQPNASIVSYSGSDNSRNFTLTQDMYNYDFYNRIVAVPPEPNGDPALSSGQGDEELVQASLQHVVINYDPETGRSIYINGALVNVADPVTGTSTVSNVWDDGFTLTLGNELSGDRPWQGQLRMLAMHNRTLTQEQVQQNFDVGVGEKYFLLFYIGHRIGIVESYIMFEVSRFDEYSYLFNKPTFINLNPDWTQTSVDIAGMRIGINGKEAVAGQAYANLITSIDGSYDPQFGQQLSSLGTIIPLENGPEGDQFFLTFEQIGGTSRTYQEASITVATDPGDPAEPVSADIGVRTFEEINATIAAITGVEITNTGDPGDINSKGVKAVYDNYFQQLPSTEAIDAFLPSHQMAIAQLALTSCSELVEGRGTIPPGSFFPGFDFDQMSQQAFGPPPPSTAVPPYYLDPVPADPSPQQLANRSLIIDPLLARTMNVIAPSNSDNLTSQPDSVVIHDMLGSDQIQTLDAAIPGTDYTSLIDEMLSCKPVVTIPPTSPPATTCIPINSIPRTAQIVKAVCAAAVGGAVMLVQ
jgi:hypothetical protein